MLLLLAWACVLVGAAWGLQWWLEGRVLAGRVSPGEALATMERVSRWLLLALGAVLSGLAATLQHLRRRMHQTGLWPPSGRWPPPAPLAADARAATDRRLRGAALAAALMGPGVLAFALARFLG